MASKCYFLYSFYRILYKHIGFYIVFNIFFEVIRLITSVFLYILYILFADFHENGTFEYQFRRVQKGLPGRLEMLFFHMEVSTFFGI